MATTWKILLLFGLASAATALDASDAADKIIPRMTAALAAHGSEWFSLPGFNISFDNSNESKWNFLYGELVSIGAIERDPANGEPQLSYLLESGDPSVVIPVIVKDVVIKYTFGCSDIFGISGYNYSFSRPVPTNSILLLDTTSESPSQCRGQAHSTPSSYSFENDGSDFSKIKPDDQYAKQCITRSYQQTQDYADLFNDRFEADYEKALEKMLLSALQAALNNLNLCS